MKTVFTAKVGDLIRYSVQYIREGYKAPQPWAPPTPDDLIDSDSQGIVLELRDDGYFVQESPENLGPVGEGVFLTRTHSLLVTFDRVLAVVSA
jgi:hypothetical protein